VAFGTPVAGTVFYRAGGTLVNPVYPAGIQSTDVVLMFTGQKPSLGTEGEVNVGEVNPPSGWTKRGEFYQGGGYTAVPGIDTGNTNLRVFSWDTPVTGQTGSASFYTDTVSNVLWAFIVRIPSGENTLVYGSASGQNTVEPTGFLSVALTDDATATNFQAGDLAIWAMCIPTDVTTPNQFSLHSITSTGALFDTATELREPDTALGSDIGGFAAYSVVTSGSSTTAPTIETEVSGSFTNVRGPIVLLRVREGSLIIRLTSDPILPVSESWVGNGLVGNKKPTTGGGRWQITSSQNPAGYNAGQAGTTVVDGYSSFRHSFTLTDATISTTVYPGSDSGYNIPIQVFARSTPGPTADITNGYYLYVQYFQISLNKRVAGVASTLSVVNVDTTGLPLSFSVIGSIITVLLNNVQVIQVTDTSITTSGYWGYEVGAASDEIAGVISSKVGPITLEIPSVSITANLSQSANSSSGLVEVQGPVTITRPNSDIAVSGWTSSNGAPLYDDIDEETPSDTDFITSPELTSTPVGATFGLTNSLSAGSYNISVRGRRTDTVGQMRVVLRDSGGVQVGATNWQTLTKTYTTYYFPITITGTATQSSVEARTEAI